MSDKPVAHCLSSNSQRDSVLSRRPAASMAALSAPRWVSTLGYQKRVSGSLASVFTAGSASEIVVTSARCPRAGVTHDGTALQQLLDDRPGVRRAVDSLY